MANYYIQSGTGKQLTKEQVVAGSFPAGTYFVESSTGKQISQSELTPSAPAQQTPAFVSVITDPVGTSQKNQEAQKPVVAPMTEAELTGTQTTTAPYSVYQPEPTKQAYTPTDEVSGGAAVSGSKKGVYRNSDGSYNIYVDGKLVETVPRDSTWMPQEETTWYKKFQAYGGEDVGHFGTAGEAEKGTYVSATQPVYGPVQQETAPTVNLQQGDTGSDVEQLQRYLISQGFMTQAQMDTGPGTYGPQTKAAVSAWQSHHGMDTAGYSGYYGPKSHQLASSLKDAGASSGQIEKIVSGSGTPTPSGDGIPRDVLDSGEADIPKAGGNGGVEVRADYLQRDGSKLSDIYPQLVEAGTMGDLDVSAGIAGIISLLAANSGTDDEYNKINSQLSSYIGDLGDQGDDWNAQLMSQGIPEMQKQLAELNVRIAQITGEIGSYDTATAEGFSGITAQAIPQGLLVGQSAAYQRQRDSGRSALASELAANASLHQAYSQNMEVALGLAEASVNYKWAGIETKLKGMQTQLSLAKDVMDRKDTKQLRIIELLIADQLNQIDELKTIESEISVMAVTAALNGAPLSVINQAKASGDAATAASILKDYLGVTGEGIYSGEYSNIVQTLQTLVAADSGAERGKLVGNAIAEALQNEDYTSAYSQIANAVESTLSGGTKTRLQNARIDYRVMSGLRDTIQAFSDAGGDMGILKGHADKIAKKIGTLKSDPEFSALAVALEREFQTYRNIMTGAAFTPQESKEYESVNPSSTKTLDLNLAVIDGALIQLENRVTETVESKVSGSKEIYNKAKGEVVSETGETEGILTEEDEGFYDW